MQKFSLSKERGKNIILLRIIFGSFGFLVAIIVFVLYTQSALSLETNPSDTGDLANFISNITIKDSNGTEITNGNFFLGDTYKFNINFSERTGTYGQFDYKTRTSPEPVQYLSYQLPDVLEVVSEVNKGEIRLSNGKIIGWYNISQTGAVEVWFGNFSKSGEPLFVNGVPTNFIYGYTDASFTLEIDAKFTKSPIGDKVKFGTNTEVTVNLKIPPPGIRVGKSNNLGSASETVEYTVEITAPSSNANAAPSVLENIKFVDIPHMGTIYLASGTEKVFTKIEYEYKGVTNDITNDVSWITPATGSGSGDINSPSLSRARLEYDFPPTVKLEPGETIIVKYTLDLQKLIKNNQGTNRYPLRYNFILDNDVKVTSGSYSDTAHSSTWVSKDFSIVKNGAISADAGDVNKIKWTSTIGDANTAYLNGGKITDTMSIPSGGADAAFQFPNASDIIITLYSSYPFNDSNRIGNRTFTAADFGTAFTITGSGRYFEFDVPASNATVAGVINIGNIKGIEITYKTNYTTPTAGSATRVYKNEVKFNDIAADRDVYIQAAPSYGSFIAKYGAYLHDGNKITWNAWIGNGDPTKGTLNGKQITDTMSIPINDSTGSISFPALLSNITIKLYKAPTGTLYNTWTFTGNDLIGTFSASNFGSAFQINAAGDTFTFKVPAATDTFGTPAVAYGDIYRVEIIYTTEVNLPELGKRIKYKNTIGTGSESDWDEVDINNQPSNPTVEKSTSRVKKNAAGEYVIEYTIKVAVPDIPAGHDNAKFFLRDELSFIGGNINNTPTNFKAELDGSLNAGEPALLYTFIHNANGNSYTWELYFGGNNLISADQSIWQYTKAKNLTITYTIPLSLKETIGDRTIEQILRSSSANFLTNSVGVRRGSGGVGPGSSVYDRWPIFKSGNASLADESVFDYTVLINPLGRSDSRMALFNDTNDAIFTDTFDSRLEYVPGSLYVIFRNSNNNVRKYYAPSSSSAAGSDFVNITTSGNSSTLKINFADLYQITDWYGSVATSLGFALPRNASEISYDYQYWYTDNQIFEIYYQLRLKDPNIESDKNDPVTFKNTATIKSTTQECDFSDEAEVKYLINPVSKTMLTDGSNVVGVEIIVNPLGRKLVPANAMPQGQYTALDTMSDNLSFYYQTIQFYTKVKDAQGNYGDWVLQPTSAVNDSLWSINNISAQKAEFILPDETPVKITYNALLMVPVGQDSGKIENKIEVMGYSDSDTKNSFKVQNSTVSASAEKMPFTLYKQDKDDILIRLSGAKFELYMSVASNNYYGTGTAPTNYIQVGGRRFYPIPSETKSTAGVNGEAEFDNEWLTPSHKGVYLLVETEAPPGYLLPNEPDNFTFFVLPGSMSASEINTLETALGKDIIIISDHIYIDNEKPSAKSPGSLKLSKISNVSAGGSANKVFEFTVAFSGVTTGLDTIRYKINNGTEGTFTNGGKIYLKDGDKAYITNIPINADYIITETNYAADGFTSDKTNNQVTGTIIDNAVLNVTFTNTYTPPPKGKVTVMKVIEDDDEPEEPDDPGGGPPPIVMYNSALDDDLEFTIILIQIENGIEVVKYIFALNKANNWTQTQDVVAGQYIVQETDMPIDYDFVSLDKTNITVTETGPDSDITITATNKKHNGIKRAGKVTIVKDFSPLSDKPADSENLTFVVILRNDRIQYTFSLNAANNWTHTRNVLIDTYDVAETNMSADYLNVSITPSTITISEDTIDPNNPLGITIYAVNQKAPPPSNTISYTIPATKSVSGNPGAMPVFSFTLRELNSGSIGDFKTGGENQTETKSGAGTVLFSLQNLAAGNTYYYQIDEINNAGTNWIYDTTPRVVTVSVDSNLNVLRNITSGSTLTFTNRYSPLSPPPPTTQTPTTTEPTTPPPTTTESPPTTTPTPTTTTEKKDDTTTTEPETTTAPSTQSTIEETTEAETTIVETTTIEEIPTTTEPTTESPTEPTIAEPDPEKDDDEWFEEPYKRIPLNNGWYAEYDEDEDLWYIYDEDGSPQGTVKLPEGMDIEDYDFGGNFIPFGNMPPKPNPETGDYIIVGLIALFMTGGFIPAMVIRKKIKRKTIN